MFGKIRRRYRRHRRKYHLSEALGVPYDDMARLFEISSSQIQQDIFVLATSGMKRDGYFVEFGATDGIGLSNSNMLERDFGWSGILAEPSPVHHEALQANRPAASIDTRCVWTHTGETLVFNLTDISSLATIDAFSGQDGWRKKRARGRRIEVETVSLLDLLRTHGAPKVIDFLSIDTEGSEHEILAAFDFEAYDVRIITCEHNHTENRERIFQLLSTKGYRRVLPELSEFDDWYVKPDERRNGGR